VPRSAWSILIAVLLLVAPGHVRGFGPQLIDPLRFNETNAIGPVLIDATTAYCFWPKWVVKESAVTAVELETGRLLWSRPANLALPLTYKLEEGWLLFESTGGEKIAENRTSGSRTFHLVNCETGTEHVFSHDPSINASVDRPRACGDRCLTPQGLVVRCSDGSKVGDLGPGEHRTVIDGDHLFVVTLLADESNLYYQQRLLRRFQLETMQVDKQLELPLEESWRMMAARGDCVIGRCNSEDREGYLVGFDIAGNRELWRLDCPKAVRTTPNFWEGESTLVLAMGVHGAIRPIQIDVTEGMMRPNHDWQDPRLMLSWHQEGGLYPDFVAANSDLIIGRWRFVQLTCIDSRSGHLIWNQFNSEHMINRVFCCDDRLSDYLVVETPHGIDILSTATGERRSIKPDQIGLKPRPHITHQEEQDDDTALLINPSSERLWDLGLMWAPMIPVAAWLIWSLFRRPRSPERTQRKLV